MTGDVIYREAVYKAIEHFKPDSPEMCKKMIDCIPAAKIYRDEEIKKIVDEAYEVGYRFDFVAGRRKND